MMGWPLMQLNLLKLKPLDGNLESFLGSLLNSGFCISSCFGLFSPRSQKLAVISFAIQLALMIMGECLSTSQYHQEASQTEITNSKSYNIVNEIFDFDGDQDNVCVLSFVLNDTTRETNVRQSHQVLMTRQKDAIAKVR